MDFEDDYNVQIFSVCRVVEGFRLFGRLDVIWWELEAGRTKARPGTPTGRCIGYTGVLGPVAARVWSTTC